jgi:membrane protein DedA with SNARE-associated domain
MMRQHRPARPLDRLGGGRPLHRTFGGQGVHVSGIVDHLLAVPAPLALGIIAALVFAEAAVFVGFVLPGETACVIGGVLAATGRLHITVLVPLVIAAAIIGDSVGYEVGRHFGPALLRTRPLRRHADRLDRARRMLRERGGWAVLVARFTAFLRAVMPGLAGLSRMPYRRFLAYNAVGGIVWAGGVTLLGYGAGSSYQRLEHLLGRAGVGLTAVFVAALLLLWWRHRAVGKDDPHA